MKPIIKTNRTYSIAHQFHLAPVPKSSDRPRRRRYCQAHVQTLRTAVHCLEARPIRSQDFAAQSGRCLRGQLWSFPAKFARAPKCAPPAD